MLLCTQVPRLRCNDGRIDVRKMLINRFDVDALAIPVVICIAALVLDRCLGEPRRWHPLVFFGRQADRVERGLNSPPGQGVARGALGLLILVAPLLAGAIVLVVWLPYPVLLVVEVLVLWLALSLRGLAEHGRAVEQPLAAGDLAQARLNVGRIVSRKAEALDETGVAAAATESMLENGADAVFASLFWFLIAGLPGVVLHRAVNTLDAMWGYRNERFLTFGRVAARLDDLLNWLPARLTAFTYAVLGQTGRALRCWFTQAPGWDSPNAGPVMAAGAGALGVALGGAAPYETGVKQRPPLGEGRLPRASDIGEAIALVRRGVWLWMVILGVIALILLAAEGVV